MNSQPHTEFLISFNRLFAESLTNDHDDNYDADRFGRESYLHRTKEKVKRLLRGKRVKPEYVQNAMNFVAPYLAELAEFYDQLEDRQSKELLIQIICFRALGYRKVMLPTNTPEYWRALADLKALEDRTDSIDPEFMHFKLGKFDLRKYGYDIDIYLSAVGIMLDFISEQYHYNSDGVDLQAKKGDLVLDIGGCWGDTALYFADRTGADGKVYSFEFIPNNLTIFRRNLDLNPRLKERIVLVPNPAWSEPGRKIFFRDNGPSSVVSFEELEQPDGTSETKTVDTFVEERDLKTVDFIKMDIEGAELPALKGAVNTISKFKPTLAIAIYHSMDDFVGIPKYLASLGAGYKFYLKHTTIHSEESILFAAAR